MTRRRFAIAAAACGLLSALPLSASGQSASFTGTLYRRGPANAPLPLAGASAYVLLQTVRGASVNPSRIISAKPSVATSATTSVPGSQWVGPVLTDNLGRFVFNSLPSGSYLLRVYVGKTRIWQDLITVPNARPYAVIVPLTPQ